jgi:phosphocarrier protein
MRSCTPKESKEMEVLVLNEHGLHARPSARFVSTARKFESEVWVQKDNLRVDGKSIMGMLTLAAGAGTKLLITTHGPDAVQASHALEQLFLTEQSMEVS